MKKGLMVLVVLAGIGLGGYALAHYWGAGYGGWGHMMGPGYAGYCWNYGPGAYGQTQTLTQKDAEGIVQNYYIGPNPNLKVGTVQDKETHFEVEVRTRDGSLVSKLAVDKQTGWIRPIY